jgi:3-oxoacyl-(acyl-carrier-protein) synthase
VSNKRDDGQRVVVTGMGVITPIGETPEEFIDSLVKGRSAITRWRVIDTSRIYSKIGGDLVDWTIKGHLGKYGKNYPDELVQRAIRLLRDVPFPAHLVAVSALRAYVSAGLPDSIRPERFGHILGGHNLNTWYAIENFKVFDEEPEFTDPLYLPRRLDTHVVAVNSEILGLKGPAWNVGSACASGNVAVATSLDLLRAGRVDAMLVSACIETPEMVGLQSLALLGALSIDSFNDEPWRASRPFDKRREGFVPGLGAGAVILETLAGARRRGAPILAEILGAASSCDASNLTKPNLDGQVYAMRGALDDAGINPEQVQYINAHATSTPIGDVIEVQAIKAVFGEHAYNIPVNATKSMTGHPLTAAGLVELVATIKQMQNNVLHPTINLEEPDPQCDLDFVPNQARDYHFDIALSNGFGFGGLNTALVIGRAPE